MASEMCVAVSISSRMSSIRSSTLSTSLIQVSRSTLTVAWVAIGDGGVGSVGRFEGQSRRVMG